MPANRRTGGVELRIFPRAPSAHTVLHVSTEGKTCTRYLTGDVSRVPRYGFCVTQYCYCVRWYSTRWILPVSLSYSIIRDVFTFRLLCKIIHNTCYRLGLYCRYVCKYKLHAAIIFCLLHNTWSVLHVAACVHVIATHMLLTSKLRAARDAAFYMIII
jgi:hypothetical protein